MRFERPLRWAPAMRMSPEITRRTVGNVVDEICKATLTAAWFDESGVLQLVPSDLLRVREPVQTVTTLDDITSLSWEDSLLSVRSGVEVTWKQALVSQSRQQRINLWQGSSNSMEQGDTIENFATPEGGVEWFGTDRSVIVLDDTNWGAYNSQIGSFTGAHYTNDNGDELPTAGRTLTVEQYALGPVGLQIIHTAGKWGDAPLQIWQPRRRPRRCVPRCGTSLCRLFGGSVEANGSRRRQLRPLPDRDVRPP